MIGTPIELPNGDQILQVRGTHAYACGCYKKQRRDKLLLGHIPNITKEEDEYSYSLMSYFDIKRSFPILFQR